MVLKKLAQTVKWLYFNVLNYINSQVWWSSDRIPGPFALPIFGSLWLYSWIGPYSHDRYHESNFDKYKKYGPVVREEGLCNFPLYHLFDAEDIDQIFKYKSDTPLRPYNEADVYYRKYRKDLYENIGMVNENGPKWLELRKSLSPPLTSRKTSYFYAEPMNEIAEELVSVISQNIDPTTNTLKGISTLVYKAGLEMMCNVALERRMGFLNNNMNAECGKIMTALKGYQTASSQAMYGLPWWKYLPAKFSGVFTRLVEHKDTLFNTIGQLVDESLAEEGSIVEESILGQLLKNHRLPIQEIKVSCVDYITAGVDTVGNSLLYTLWLISLDQRVQKKLRQELLTIVNNFGPDNLQKLPYLRACVEESFRMYPTASQIARLTEKDSTTLKNGMELPKNSVVLCHTHVASRLEENFTCADTYHPERWISDERDPDWNHRPEIVLPFGSGKRICPGKRLAEQEIYIMTAKIFKNFILVPKGSLEIEFNWLMSPVEPMEFRIELV